MRSMTSEQFQTVYHFVSSHEFDISTSGYQFIQRTMCKLSLKRILKEFEFSQKLPIENTDNRKEQCAYIILTHRRKRNWSISNLHLFEVCILYISNHRVQISYNL